MHPLCRHAEVWGHTCHKRAHRARKKTKYASLRAGGRGRSRLILGHNATGKGQKWPTNAKKTRFPYTYTHCVDMPKYGPTQATNGLTGQERRQKREKPGGGFCQRWFCQSRETRPHLGPEIHVMTTYPGFEWTHMFPGSHLHRFHGKKKSTSTVRSCRRQRKTGVNGDFVRKSWNRHSPKEKIDFFYKDWIKHVQWNILGKLRPLKRLTYYIMLFS